MRTSPLQRKVIKKQTENIRATQLADTKFQKICSEIGEDANERERAHWVMLQIEEQMPATPEGKLCVAIIGCAITDLLSDFAERSIDAARYLNKDLRHAEICGVDPNWVRHQFKKARVYIPERDVLGQLD